jgi:hypothetical protein
MSVNRPDYRSFSNNCHNWARYLVEDITGIALSARTISEVLAPFARLSGASSAPLLLPVSAQSGELTYMVVSPTNQCVVPPVVHQIDPAPTHPTTSSVSDARSSDLWEEIVKCLLPSEVAYIKSLGLGRPCLCDSFLVFKDGEVPASTFCILFPHVVLLCRIQPISTSFDTTQGASQQGQVALIYGYLYPRHLYSIELNENMNGFPIPPSLTPGFLLVCEGTWGDSRHYHSLNLQPTRALPELPKIWTQALDMFCKQNIPTLSKQHIPHIGTALDRLPLGHVIPFSRQSDQQEFASEIDIKVQVGPYPRVFRAVFRTPLEYLRYPSLYEIVREMLNQNEIFVSQFYIGYTDRQRAVKRVSEAFPIDTDYGWREFFAGYFYIFVN